MITVQLENLLFRAFHGVYEEERILGNDYVVNAMLEFHENVDVITHIHDTINYADIYELIGKKMRVPTPLLETIVMEIGNQIHSEYPSLKSIRISLKKMHPPVAGMQGSATVTWQKQF
jgi:7,8-dihydroneopterin aldolase/epimerase/oxygenase